MPLEAPNLDDRRFDDIVAEARALIPRYMPEWTNHNASDPGITLIQLFAWLSEMLLYRMNKVPERNYIAFLQLIGVERKPAFPASAEITFTLTSPNLKTVIVPRGTRIGASPAPVPPSAFASPALPPPTEEEPLVFETDEPIIAIGAELKYVQVFDGVNYIDYSESNKKLGPSYPAFGSRLRVNSALYVGLASNNAFPTDEMNLAIRVYSDPQDLRPVKAVVSGLDALPPATIVWEFWDGGFWRVLDILKDESFALTHSGHLYFRGPAKAALRIVGPIVEKVYWLRCRLIDFHYDNPPRLSAVVTNTVRATAVATVRDEVAGSSDGEPNQLMGVRHVPVFAKPPRSVEERLLEKTLQKTPPTEAQQLTLDQAMTTRELVKGFLLQVDEGKGLAPWEEVDNFYDSDPEDRHYILNRTTGTITFGDRRNGAIPLAGVNNVVVSFYRYGGGVRSNVGVSAIGDLQTAVSGVDSVTNRWPAEGGEDEESIEDTKARAPQELKARDRAVTAQDFEFLALETPGVRIRRAHALPLFHPDFSDVEVPGVITVIVVPDSAEPNPLPSESTMKEVGDWLNARRLLTCELFIAPPRYKLIRVVASVKAKATANAALVKTQTEQALTSYLHPLVGGDDGQGWPLGGTVRFSDLFRVVFQVDGVLTVDDLRIVIDGARKGRCENAEISKEFLVYSQGHDISVTLEASGT